jgi:hypothetical protein
MRTPRAKRDGTARAGAAPGPAAPGPLAGPDHDRRPARHPHRSGPVQPGADAGGHRDLARAQCRRTPAGRHRRPDPDRRGILCPGRPRSAGRRPHPSADVYRRRAWSRRRRAARGRRAAAGQSRPRTARRAVCQARHHRPRHHRAARCLPARTVAQHADPPPRAAAAARSRHPGPRLSPSCRSWTVPRSRSRACITARAAPSCTCWPPAWRWRATGHTPGGSGPCRCCEYVTATAAGTPLPWTA